MISTEVEKYCLIERMKNCYFLEFQMGIVFFSSCLFALVFYLLPMHRLGKVNAFLQNVAWFHCSWISLKLSGLTSLSARFFLFRKNILLVIDWFDQIIRVYFRLHRVEVNAFLWNTAWLHCPRVFFFAEKSRALHVSTILSAYFI